MFYDDAFVSGLTGDPVNGVLEIVRKAEEVLPNADWQRRRAIFVEAYALISEMIKAKMLPLPPSPELALSGDPHVDVQLIGKYLDEVQRACTAIAAKQTVQSLGSKFRASLQVGFRYEFSQGDLNKIQALINELRDLITASEDFEVEHQQRLLKRLETLQSEMHKKMSDLDKFWGLIGDAGVVLGKFGQNAKPIVDRIKEITEIVWQTQSRAEELPSGIKLPLLEQPRGTDSE